MPTMKQTSLSLAMTRTLPSRAISNNGHVFAPPNPACLDPLPRPQVLAVGRPIDPDQD